MPPVRSKPSRAKDIVDNRKHLKHVARQKASVKLGPLTAVQEMNIDQLIDESTTDCDMIDVGNFDIDKILKNLKRLPNSIHSKPDATGAENAATSRNNLGTATTGQHTLPLIEVAVPAMRRAAIADANKSKGAASTPNPLEHTPGTTEENPSPHSGNEGRQTEECPPELRALIEAEERRAAKTAENVKICTAAINGVENALSPLSKGSSVQFIDSMKVYIRAAIAQFMIAGPGTVLPSLPPRPESQATGSKIIERAAKKQDEPQSKVTHDKVSQAKTNWASITRTGIKTSPAATKVAQAMPKAANSTRTAQNSTEPTKPAVQDERLFLRLEKEHPWRKLSPFGVGEAITQMLEIPQTKIEHVYRVPTGFAIRAENQEARALMLSLAGSFAQQDAILEKASDLASLRIATVPVAINTIMGKVLITEKMVADEIVRVTKAVLSNLLSWFGSCND